MRNCFDIGGTLQGEVSRLAPPLYRNFAQTCFREVIGDNLRFRLRSFRNLIPQRLRNPAMEHLPPGLGEAGVNHVAHQGMLEGVDDIR